MRPAVSVLVLALLLFSACSRESAFEPIPPQSPAVNAPDPPSVPCYFSMSEARADQAIVQGIPLGLGSGIHRWTGEDFAVRCKLPTGGPWNIAMDFIAAAKTMRDTGPITLAFKVNGTEIAHVRCDLPGARQFRAPLPADIATAGADIVLQVSIDKPWIAPDDGSKLGVLLTAIGFLQP